MLPALVAASNPVPTTPKDIHAPSVTSLNVELVGTWPVEEAVDLYVYDNQAYVAHHFDWYDQPSTALLSILDISDPARPTEIDHIEGPYGDSYQAIYVDASYIYTASSSPSIVAYQKTDLENYVCFQKFSVYSKVIEMWSHSSYGLFINANYSDYTGNGLQVFKPIPTQPYDHCEFVTSYEITGKVTAATYDDQYAYIGTSDGALWILDFSDPNQPSRLSQTPYGSKPIDAIATAPGYVYLSQGAEIKIIDVSDPASPGAAQTFTSPVKVAQLAAQGGYLYITFEDDILYWKDGLYVYDVRDSSAPVQAGYYLDYDEKAFGNALHLANDLVFSADERRMYILRFTDAPQSEPAVLLETLSTGVWVDGIEAPHPCELTSTTPNGLQDTSLVDCPTVQANSRLEFKSSESKQKLKLWLQCLKGMFYAISVDEDDLFEGFSGQAAVNFILIATAAACEQLQPWTTKSNASPFIIIGHEHGALRYRFQQEALSNEIRTGATTIMSDGANDLSVAHDQLANQTTVGCYYGSVILVPKNPTLPPIALSTGQQVEITSDSVGPITEITYQVFVPLAMKSK
jgi:hypothetical protein